MSWWDEYNRRRLAEETAQNTAIAAQAATATAALLQEQAFREAEKRRAIETLFQLTREHPRFLNKVKELSTRFFDLGNPTDADTLTSLRDHVVASATLSTQELDDPKQKGELATIQQEASRATRSLDEALSRSANQFASSLALVRTQEFAWVNQPTFTDLRTDYSEFCRLCDEAGGVKSASWLPPGMLHLAIWWLCVLVASLSCVILLAMNVVSGWGLVPAIGLCVGLIGWATQRTIQYTSDGYKTDQLHADNCETQHKELLLAASKIEGKWKPRLAIRDAGKAIARIHEWGTFDSESHLVPSSAKIQDIAKRLNQWQCPKCRAVSGWRFLNCGMCGFESVA
jgi:hypothetical protein